MKTEPGKLGTVSMRINTVTLMAALAWVILACLLIVRGKPIPTFVDFVREVESKVDQCET